MGKSVKQKAHETYETELAHLQKELYIQAFIAYKEVKKQEPEPVTQQIKGTLVQKKHIRKKAGRIYSYTYHYIQVSEYKDGKRKTKRKYVSKEELPQVIEQMWQKKDAENPLESRLSEKEAILQEAEKQLQKYISKGMLPQIEILQKEAEQRYAQQKQAAAYRAKEVENVKGNPAYSIRTEAGELVVSKNECIVANILYHRKIPYFYEKPLHLKPRRDGTPVVMHPDFTIKMGEKEIYIEILGMMETEEYATAWEYRLATYKVNGIQIGENLVALEFPSTGEGRQQEVDCFKIQHVLVAIMKNKLPQAVVRCGNEIQALT